MKKYSFMLVIAILLMVVTACGKNASSSSVSETSAVTTASETSVIPEAPNPATHVADFAGILKDAKTLEQALMDDSAAQIAVVTVKNLGGKTPQDFATELGNKWGVGDKDKNNGIVILVKPKTEKEKGQIYIATGEGTEKVITDEMVQKIIDEKVLPILKANNDYDKAIMTAITELKALL